MDLRIGIETAGTTAPSTSKATCDLATAPELQGRAPVDCSRPTSKTRDRRHASSSSSTRPGSASILGAMRRMREGGGTLQIAGAHGTVRRVLEVTDLDKVIPLVDAETA